MTVTHHFKCGTVRDNLKGVTIPKDIADQYYKALARAVHSLAVRSGER